MIEIRGLRKTLNEKRVLDGVDLEIGVGDTLIIMGPSGTGKSVLLKHIVGLMDPDEGDVLVDGASVVRADGRGIAAIRSKIAYVFQNSALFDSLTVAGNVHLGLAQHRCGRDGIDCGARVREALEHVNLDPDEVLGLLPAELSGGMQKRVAIARAIVGRARYILYDEPTTGLDPVNASIINDLIDRLNREMDSTTVIVTHDVESAFFLADRIALLARGIVQAEGSPSELRNSEVPAVRAFLNPRAAAGAA